MYLPTDIWTDMFGSSVDKLEEIMKTVNDISFPSLDSKEFQDFWELNFGFAVMVAIFAAIISLFSYAKQRDLAIVLNAGLTLITTFIIGYFLPPALYLLTWFSKNLSLIAAKIVNGTEGKDGNVWYQIYVGFMNLKNPIMVLGNRMFGELLTGLLDFLVSSVVTSMFFFAFLTLAAFPVRLIGFGFTVFRIGIAGLLTTVFLQPVVLFVLAIGAVSLKFSGQDVGSFDNSLALILALACIMPILLFFTLFRRLQKVAIEGPLFNKNMNPSFGSTGGFSLNRPQNRNYAGNIPQAGETMESVASKASWVGNKLALASKALAVAAPHAAAIVGGTAVAANAAATTAGNRAEKSKANAEAHSSGDSENHTLTGATVVAADNFNQSSTSQDTSTPEPSDAPTKTPKGTVVRNGASKVASATSSAAFAAEKAARWTSGAQRKAKKEVDRQLRR